MSYLCNRNRETKIANDKVPWMSGLVSGLQNRVRRFESARNLQTTVKSSSQYPKQRVSLRKRQNKNRKSEDGAERENMPQKTSEAINHKKFIRFCFFNSFARTK
mgnify:CR=1 FL=1